MAIKYRSLEYTSKMLETFFKNTLGDEVTTQEIYRAWGRPTDDEKQNKAWLSSSMLHLKHHELISPLYERRNSRQTLVGLKLTDKGKAILGKDRESGASSTTTSTPTSTIQTLNYDSMMGLVARFQRENPQYKVRFTIELKEEGSEEK